MSILKGKSLREVLIGSGKGVERLLNNDAFLTSNLEIIIYATNKKSSTFPTREKYSCTRARRVRQSYRVKKRTL